jgi:hypothetical protein
MVEAGRGDGGHMHSIDRLPDGYIAQQEAATLQYQSQTGMGAPGPPRRQPMALMPPAPADDRDASDRAWDRADVATGVPRRSNSGLPGPASSRDTRDFRDPERDASRAAGGFAGGGGGGGGYQQQYQQQQQQQQQQPPPPQQMSAPRQQVGQPRSRLAPTSSGSSLQVGKYTASVTSFDPNVIEIDGVYMRTSVPSRQFVSFVMYDYDVCAKKRLNVECVEEVEWGGNALPPGLLMCMSGRQPWLGK